MPKQSGLMSDVERAICARLKQFREAGRWPRHTFAAKLDITEAKLVSIENGWTPLRYNLAWRIATHFNVNMQWLATGREPKTPAVSIPSEIASELQENWLFSAVYAGSLSSHFEGARQFLSLVNELRLQLDDICAGRQVGHSPGQPVSFWVARPEWLPAMRRKATLLQEYSAVIKGKLDELEEAIRVSEDFHKTHPDEFPPQVVRIEIGGADSTGKEHLTQTGETYTSPSMPSLAELRKRLKAATMRHGARSALAVKFGVSRQAVSQWISGASAPEADTTLRLLEWVTMEEAKQKQSAGSAPSPAAPAKPAPAKAAKGKAKR